MLQPPLGTGMSGCCHMPATSEVLAVPAPTCPYSCWRVATSLPRVSLDQCPGHQSGDVRCRALLSMLPYLQVALQRGMWLNSIKAQYPMVAPLKGTRSNDESNILPCLGHPRAHTDGRSQPVPIPAWAVSRWHLHKGSLCDNDVLGLAVLVDEPRIGLHPLPAILLRQQAEDREAALARLHHCREEAHMLRAVSTSPEAGLPPVMQLFPAGISKWSHSRSMAGTHRGHHPS